VGRAESVGAEFEGFGFGGVGVGAIAAVAGVDDWEAELEREMLSREEELECGREEDLVRREEKVMSMCSGRLKGVCEVIEASAGEEMERGSTFETGSTNPSAMAQAREESEVTLPRK
jgi:hypothetical protein